MLISKSKGEKLSDKKLKDVYGGYCGNYCGTCDCTASGGDKFFPAFDAEMTAFQTTWFS